MSDLAAKINFLITELLDGVQRDLLAKGVSKNIVDSVFSQENVDDFEAAPAEAKLTKQRFLPPNNSEPQSQTTSTAQSFNNSFKNGETTTFAVKDKYPQNYKDGSVVLVLNYTEKTHALFGDFGGQYSKFKDDVLLLQKQTFKAAPGLVFGFGWLIFKNKLQDAKKALLLARIKFREVDMEVYLDEVKGGKSSPKSKPSAVLDEPEEERVAERVVKKPVVSEKSVKSQTQSYTTAVREIEEIENDEFDPPPQASKLAPKATAKVVQPPPVKTKPIVVKEEFKAAPTSKAVVKESIIEIAKVEPKTNELVLNASKKAIKNIWGNLEDPKSGFVFVKLPVGKNGNPIAIAVGYQHPEPEMGLKGLDTVLHFDEGLEEECKLLGYRPLTEPMIAKVKLVEPKLAAKLQALWNRTGDEFDDVDDIDDGEDDEDDDDDENDDDDV